jgi:SAM-dependent methyltransferase
MRRTVQWPNNKKICATFTVALEAYLRGGHHKTIETEGVNMVAVSHANYGGNAGIWRIMEILDRHQARATIDINGLAAERWPEADVTGADVSRGMVEQARLRSTSGRQRYEVADASNLPYPDGAFELVAMNNMIPFFDEIERVTAPGGQVAIAFSRGPQTPIWVPLERVRSELERRNFSHVATFSGGPGLSLLARKADRP